ncbi:hypothetical protein [Corallococcus aberystwythensis]|uniref:hypothetical protein n=1 Tax=Corallococcus aberystwythensis TaxID=2316722 RepID=UPI0013152696|nr:hypothetical protein [Corallococcus aberystwythensis]
MPWAPEAHAPASTAGSRDRASILRSATTVPAKTNEHTASNVTCTEQDSCVADGA